MKNVLSLLTGIMAILIVGFSFVKWQANQNDSDRVRQVMEMSIQKSSTKSEDMSQRTNNSDVKTLRVVSLQTFMDNYFGLYNSGVHKSNLQTPDNTSFNFYLANAKDLKDVNKLDVDVSHGVSVIVKQGKIDKLSYNSKAGNSKTVTGDDTNTLLDLNTAVDVKMVKVHSLVKDQTFDATAALSVKRSPVASPVSNKLDTLQIPYKTRANSSLFTKDLDIRNSLGVKIETSKITYRVETKDGKSVPSSTELTDSEYKAIYEAVDENSGSKLRVNRKVEVDQNLPLIETPNTVIAYVGDDAFIQARAFEMPNGAHGTRGKEITDLLKQDLTKDQLNKAGTYTQNFTVTDSNGKSSKKSRTLVLKANTPVFNVTDPVIGIYSVGRMPATSELMAGVTAKSPKDGDLTNLIEIDKSSVDASKAGKYTVTYRVTAPTGGLTATTTRTIEFK